MVAARKDGGPDPVPCVPGHMISTRLDTKICGSALQGPKLDSYNLHLVWNGGDRLGRSFDLCDAAVTKICRWQNIGEWHVATQSSLARVPAGFCYLCIRICAIFVGSHPLYRKCIKNEKPAPKRTAEIIT